jgi:hypothetical protein
MPTIHPAASRQCLDAAHKLAGVVGQLTAVVCHVSRVIHEADSNSPLVSDARMAEADQAFARLTGDLTKITHERLGIIGRDHLCRRLLAMGVRPESLRYEKKFRGGKSKNPQTAPGEKASFPEPPSVLECAFGWLDVGEALASWRDEPAAGALGKPRRVGGVGLLLDHPMRDAARDARDAIGRIHLSGPTVAAACYRNLGEGALEHLEHQLAGAIGALHAATRDIKEDLPSR